MWYILLKMIEEDISMLTNSPIFLCEILGLCLAKKEVLKMKMVLMLY